jgi:hypothetical protein
MRKDTMLLGGTALFAGILAFHFWNQVREGNRLTAELRQQVEELKAARVADAGRRAASGAALQTAVVPVAAPMSGPPVAQGLPGSPNAPAPVAAVNCDAMLARAKQSASLATATTAAELNLSPAETLRVTEIREAQMTATLPCGGSTLNPEQLQAQLEAILGPVRFEQLQELNATNSTRQNMTTLASQLTAIGVPLDEQQARQLSTTILDENRRSRREATSTVAPSDPYARLAYEEENLRLTEARYERTLRAAQSYLRPEQLAQLRVNTTRQLELMREILKRMRASVDAGRGIPPSTSFALVNGQTTTVITNSGGPVP